MVLKRIFENIKRHGELFIKNPASVLWIVFLFIKIIYLRFILRKRVIVLEASQNYFYHAFEPIYKILKINSVYKIYFAYRFSDNDCKEYFLKMGIPASNILWAEIAKYLPFDMFLSHDIAGNTFPLSFLKTKKIELFHGIGSIGMDKLKPNLSRFDFLFEIGPQYNEIHEKWEEVKNQKIKLYNVGYPKTDVIFKNEYNVPEMRKKMNIPADARVILYSPHWSPESGIHRFGRRTTDILLAEKYVVLMKLHNYIFREFKGFDWMNVINEYKEKYENFHYCSEPDTQQYYLVADVTISDIGSTTPFEFMLTGRPAILFNGENWIEKYGKIQPEYDVYSQSFKIDSPDELPSLLNSFYDGEKKVNPEIENLAKKYLYNHGKSAEVAAKIIDEINEIRGR